VPLGHSKDAYRFDFIVAPMQPLTIPFLAPLPSSPLPFPFPFIPFSLVYFSERDMQLCNVAPFTKNIKLLLLAQVAPFPSHRQLSLSFSFLFLPLFLYIIGSLSLSLTTLSITHHPEAPF